MSPICSLTHSLTFLGTCKSALFYIIAMPCMHTFKPSTIPFFPASLNLHGNPTQVKQTLITGTILSKFLLILGWWREHDKWTACMLYRPMFGYSTLLIGTRIPLLWGKIRSEACEITFYCTAAFMLSSPPSCSSPREKNLDRFRMWTNTVAAISPSSSPPSLQLLGAHSTPVCITTGASLSSSLSTLLSIRFRFTTPEWIRSSLASMPFLALYSLSLSSIDPFVINGPPPFFIQQNKKKNKRWQRKAMLMALHSPRVK